jgi:hypothetical protein
VKSNEDVVVVVGLLLVLMFGALGIRFWEKVTADKLAAESLERIAVSLEGFDRANSRPGGVQGDHRQTQE